MSKHQLSAKAREGLRILVKAYGLDEPAKTARKTSTKGQPRKTASRKPAKNATVEGHRCLTSGNRAKFIADHDWAQDHTSVLDLSRSVVVQGQPLVGTWAIGSRNVERAKGVTVVGKAKPVTAKATKKGKKGKKAKAQAEVVTPEPKVRQRVAFKDASPAEQARRKAPRNQFGHTTPKREWWLRNQYAESNAALPEGHEARFTPKQIDKKVAKAFKKGHVDPVTGQPSS